MAVKDAAGENFPVGSILLPAALRPHVAAFYTFARAADDIADNPALDSGDKIARLNRMAEAVAGGQADDSAPARVRRMRESLAATGVPARHCLDLLDAFRQDAVKRRYEDWDDLMSSCDRSAAPVGRYLLDLHGEDKALWPAADALCNALQVLNHLQDCGEDYREMDRVYIPEPWLAVEGIGADALAAAAASASLRRVLDRLLDGVDGLLDIRTAGRPHEEPAPRHGNRGHPGHSPQARRPPSPPRPAGRTCEAGPDELCCMHA